MITPELKIDLVSEAQKTAPPVVIVAANHVTGMTLNDWVMIATLLYIGLQASWLLWKWWKAYKTKGWTPKDG